MPRKIRNVSKAPEPISGVSPAQALKGVSVSADAAGKAMQTFANLADAFRSVAGDRIFSGTIQTGPQRDAQGRLILSPQSDPQHARILVASGAATLPEVTVNEQGDMFLDDGTTPQSGIYLIGGVPTSISRIPMRGMPVFIREQLRPAEYSIGVSPGNEAHRAAAEAGPAESVRAAFDSEDLRHPVDRAAAEETARIAREEPSRIIREPIPMRPDLSAVERDFLAQWTIPGQGRHLLQSRMWDVLSTLAQLRCLQDTINRLSVPEYMFDYAIRLFWPGEYTEFLRLNDTSLMSRVARRLFLSVLDDEYMNRIALKIRLTNELCRVMEHDPDAWNKLTGPEDTRTPFAGPYDAVERGL